MLLGFFNPHMWMQKKNSPCLIQLTRTSAADERTVPRLICKTLCETLPPLPPPPASKSKREKAQISGRDILVPFLRMLLRCKRGAAPDGRLPDVCDFYFVRVKSQDKGFEPPVCGLKTYTPTEKDHFNTFVVLYFLCWKSTDTIFEQRFVRVTSPAVQLSSSLVFMFRSDTC